VRSYALPAQKEKTQRILCAGTELTYCVLSLTAKMYLGWFLLVNVIMADGSVTEALEPPADAAARLR